MELTFNDLPKAITEIKQLIQRIEQKIESNSNTEPEKESDLLISKEVCELLNISQTTRWRWEKEGKIKSCGIGGKRYYKKSELLESLILKK